MIVLTMTIIIIIITIISVLMIVMNILLHADGIGTPDPNHRHLVSWCLYHEVVTSAFVQTVYLGL